MILRVAALVAIALAADARQGNRPADIAAFLAKVDAAMDLKPGSFAADVGSGDSPDHPQRISKAIGPSGKLVCEDIDPSALRKLEAKLKAGGISNVEFVAGAPDDPRLPAHTFDAILISNAYHEFTDHRAMLHHLREALKTGGKLVVVEAISDRLRDKSREEQAKAHELAPEKLKAELEAAGFRQLNMIVLRHAEATTRYLVSAQPE